MTDTDIEVKELKPFYKREDQCLWCKKPASPHKVEVVGDEVLIHYRCENGKCTYPLPKMYEFGMKWTGKGYVKKYEDSLKENETS